MERLKQLIREPALLIDLAETVVLMVIAFGVGLSGDQQTYIVAGVIATLGLLKAISTRPFAVPALTDFGRAALALMASFGVGLTADQIALAVTSLGLIATIVMRGQITPTYSPVVDPTGAGSGPVGQDSVRRRTQDEFGRMTTQQAILGLAAIVVVVVLVVLIF